MDNEFRFLEFEGIQIAAFIESHTQNEHTSYYPQNILYFIEQGQLNIKVEHKLYTISKGNFCIVRKFTTGTYFKTWDDHESYAIVKAMLLKDDFIQEAIEELGLSKPTKAITQPVIHLKNNVILMGLYNNLTLYLAKNEEPDKHLMFLKTKEALLGILKSNPDHLALFYEFSKSVKAELREFITHHITSDLSLNALAKLSGRSLSTFNRDFRKTFQTAPHKWILKERLKKAKNLLLSNTRTSSEIYLDLGFKDLAHFSRTFKKEFGISPSEINKKNI